MEGQPQHNAALKCYSEAATSKFGSCKNSLWCSVVLSILGAITKWTPFASLLAVFNFLHQAAWRQFSETSSVLIWQKSIRAFKNRPGKSCCSCCLSLLYKEFKQIYHNLSYCYMILMPNTSNLSYYYI